MRLFRQLRTPCLLLCETDTFCTRASMWPQDILASIARQTDLSSNERSQQLTSCATRSLWLNAKMPQHFTARDHLEKNGVSHTSIRWDNKRLSRRCKDHISRVVWASHTRNGRHRLATMKQQPQPWNDQPEQTSSCPQMQKVECNKKRLKQNSSCFQSASLFQARLQPPRGGCNGSRSNSCLRRCHIASD